LDNTALDISMKNIMTSDLFGRFYFKQTSNGNLTGEFSNSTSNQISTESCDYLPQKNPDIGKRANDYIGNYDSTWQENGAPHFAKLEITKNKINDRLFIFKVDG